MLWASKQFHGVICVKVKTFFAETYASSGAAATAGAHVERQHGHCPVAVDAADLPGRQSATVAIPETALAAADASKW